MHPLSRGPMNVAVTIQATPIATLTDIFDLEQ